MMPTNEAIQLIKESRFKSSDEIVRKIGCNWVTFLSYISMAGMSLECGMIIKPLNKIDICDGSDLETESVRKAALNRAYYN